jgi:hypothetical protein
MKVTNEGSAPAMQMSIAIVSVGVIFGSIRDQNDMRMRLGMDKGLEEDLSRVVYE